jgi:hypothetical protein
MQDAPLRVGVFPAHEHTRRPRLWSALEAAYPVSFEGREHGAVHQLDGVIAIDDGSGATPSADLPWPPAGLPCLFASGTETGERPTPRAVALAHDTALARPLRGAHLSDAHGMALEPPLASGREIVLATFDGAPAWTLAQVGAAPLHRVACAPVELGEGEALRERLRPGRCLALLALAQFLCDLSDGSTKQPGLRPQTQLHAAFVFDDPNLHWPSYGHLRYTELLRHADTHGYHLAVAMVPLDGWFADPRVARLFREGAARLSVCTHGNDHYGPELARPRTVAEGVALGGQALRRMAAFERRTGVGVDRVMVPPHEQISEPMARALWACGFEALCTTRPYPWMATSLEVPWLTRPPEAGALSAWHPADIVAGGLPVLLRADFIHPREDLVLRAFLGQPLILYSHHDLLAHGLAPFAEAAAAINTLGEVRWCSLAKIARASTSIRPAQTATPIATPAPRRRLRPVLRRVAAEGQVRLQAVLDSRRGRARSAAR